VVFDHKPWYLLLRMLVTPFPPHTIVDPSLPIARLLNYVTKIDKSKVELLQPDDDEVKAGTRLRFEGFPVDADADLSTKPNPKVSIIERALYNH
jgi:hypothetical protein